MQALTNLFSRLQVKHEQQAQPEPASHPLLDIFHNAFFYLDARSLFRCSRVSCQWRQIVSSHRRWNHLVAQDFPEYDAPRRGIDAYRRYLACRKIEQNLALGKSKQIPLNYIVPESAIVFPKAPALRDFLVDSELTLFRAKGNKVKGVDLETGKELPAIQLKKVQGVGICAIRRLGEERLIIVQFVENRRERLASFFVANAKMSWEGLPGEEFLFMGPRDPASPYLFTYTREYNCKHACIRLRQLGSHEEVASFNLKLGESPKFCKSNAQADFFMLETNATQHLYLRQKDRLDHNDQQRILLFDAKDSLAVVQPTNGPLMLLRRVQAKDGLHLATTAIELAASSVAYSSGRLAIVTNEPTVTLISLKDERSANIDVTDSLVLGVALYSDYLLLSTTTGLLVYDAETAEPLHNIQIGAHTILGKEGKILICKLLNKPQILAVDLAKGTSKPIAEADKASYQYGCLWKVKSQLDAGTARPNEQLASLQIANFM